MTRELSDTRIWERGALAAAVVILLSPVLYLLFQNPAQSFPNKAVVQFVGSEKCKNCHESVYNKWRGSDHDRAMDVAGAETVLGDFNDASFTDPYNNVTTRFYRKGEKYFVATQGPDGRLGEFEITHTFGATPLQQYLAPFPGGRLQCLNIAWDVENRRWYRLPPDKPIPPGDWLHWTAGGQTWNTMCAECHSTRLRKGYDPDTETYRTSWFEIDVGCEACHGPGAAHLRWAEKPPLARSKTANYGLTVVTRDLTNDRQIKICAPCHSRRFQLGDNPHANAELLDIMVPQLLSEGLYYPDGQILDEVYVYGSFTQSKMYQRGVRCSDCHDVHSLKLHKQDNALCCQCHRAEVYDSKAHHFHKDMYEGKPSDGHLCVKCHMPGRYYMGIDYRPDHSLRVPRPDLSIELGTPNACSVQGCHADKSLAWNSDYFQKWYGETRKPHYGVVIAAGRAHRAGADAALIATAEDVLLPAIVRATALSLLRSYPTADSRACLAKALEDADALIRYTAIRSLEFFDAETRRKRIAPKLYDPVKAVRMEAALMLSMLPEEQLRKDDRQAFESALAEYRDAMRYNADLAPQRYNLGNLAFNLGHEAEALAAYEKSIAIDGQFYPAKVNLAMLLNSQGKNKEAEKLLRQVVEQEPEQYEVAYSLGLLLGEMGRYEDAAEYLGRAAAGMQYARAYYNLGQVLMALGQGVRAEEALLQAQALSSEDQDVFLALTRLYLSTRRPDKALAMAERLLEAYPEHQGAKELLRRFGK